MEDLKKRMAILGAGGRPYANVLSEIMEIPYYDTIFDGSSPKYYRNKPELQRKKAQPRNEQCNCGSGKKYKRCCGV